MRILAVPGHIDGGIENPRRREHIPEADAGIAGAAHRAQPPLVPRGAGRETGSAVARALEHERAADILEAGHQIVERQVQLVLHLADHAERPALQIPGERAGGYFPVVADEVLVVRRRARIEVRHPGLGVHRALAEDSEAALPLDRPSGRRAGLGAGIPGRDRSRAAGRGNRPEELPPRKGRGRSHGRRNANRPFSAGAASGPAPGTPRIPPLPGPRPLRRGAALRSLVQFAPAAGGPLPESRVSFRLRGCDRSRVRPEQRSVPVMPVAGTARRLPRRTVGNEPARRPRQRPFPVRPTPRTPSDRVLIPG